MSDPFLGEIRIFAGNYPPKNWAFCNGAILPISQYTALFALLGTNFGGNGTVNFGLPNLVDRVPMNWGQGPGLTPRVLGEMGGDNSVAIDATTMAAHTHLAQASSGGGTDTAPTNNFWSTSSSREKQFNAPPPDALMALALDPAGGSQAHENRQPYLAVNYIIALSGIFPSRP
jgi:microcystin-dependent protein